MSRATTPFRYEEDDGQSSIRGTPRQSRRSERRRRSPQYTPRRKEETPTREYNSPSNRRRKSKSKSGFRWDDSIWEVTPERKYNSPRDRRRKSKSKSSFRWDDFSPKDERSASRNSRRQKRSPVYRKRVDLEEEEVVCQRDSGKRKERYKTYPSRDDEKRGRSPRDVPRGRYYSEPVGYSKECKLSEEIPDCRLYDIEARGGTRDFGKWFKKLPPNWTVDKDVRTDRGVFKKDNFQSSRALDKYLGIKNSRSPTDRRR